MLVCFGLFWIIKSVYLFSLLSGLSRGGVGHGGRYRCIRHTHTTHRTAHREELRGHTEQRLRIIYIAMHRTHYAHTPDSRLQPLHNVCEKYPRNYTIAKVTETTVDPAPGPRRARDRSRLFGRGSAASFALFSACTVLVPCVRDPVGPVSGHRVQAQPAGPAAARACSR